MMTGTKAHGFSGDVPDEVRALVAEIDDLKAENERLQSELKQLRPITDAAIDFTKAEWERIAVSWGKWPPPLNIELAKHYTIQQLSLRRDRLELVTEAYLLSQQGIDRRSFLNTTRVTFLNTGEADWKSKLDAAHKEVLCAGEFLDHVWAKQRQGTRRNEQEGGDKYK